MHECNGSRSSSNLFLPAYALMRAKRVTDNVLLRKRKFQYDEHYGKCRGDRIPMALCHDDDGDDEDAPQSGKRRRDEAGADQGNVHSKHTRTAASGGGRHPARVPKRKKTDFDYLFDPNKPLSLSRERDGRIDDLFEGEFEYTLCQHLFPIRSLHITYILPTYFLHVTVHNMQAQ